MQHFRLGINLCFAKRRWPEPDSWVEIVSDLGLDLVEFDSDLLDPGLTPPSLRRTISKEIKERFEEAGIEIYTYCSGQVADAMNMLGHPDPRIAEIGKKWWTSAIEACSELGAKGVSGKFATFGEKIASDASEYAGSLNTVIESVRELASKAASLGQSFILWEQMYSPMEPPYTTKQTREMLDRVNQGSAIPVYTLIDLGHMCCRAYSHDSRDLDPYAWLKEFGSVSPVVHLQQTGGESSNHWPFTAEYNRRGRIEASRVLEALEASGSTGNALILELGFSLAIPGREVIRALKESVDYWTQYL